MGGILQVDTIQNNNASTLITQTNATTLTFGITGQNIVIPSGVTFNTASATINYPAGSISNADIASAAAIATSKLGTGAVLQVVNATDSTERTTTSTSFVTASNTLSVSITPSSSSNKILILNSTSIGNTDSAQNTYATIFRGATNLGTSNGMNNIYHDATSQIYASNHISFLDSPSTTSATTYQLYIRVSGGTGKMNSSGTQGSITLLEIKG